jgi:IstB-like ATP binding protein
MCALHETDVNSLLEAAQLVVQDLDRMADLGARAAGDLEAESVLQELASVFSRWHEQIGDPTIADGILDRLVHNAHRIEMRGESMRKKRNPPQDEKKE